MKEPIKVLVSEKNIINFYKEDDFIFGSPDKIKEYDKIFVSGNINKLASQIGIELFEGQKIKASCLIGSEVGGTRITDNSILVSCSALVICCSNTVFKLTIPELNLEWKTVADSCTCFAIYYVNGEYIIHGELEITKVDKNGRILWQKGGRDIWATAEGINDFSISENYILATDWDYYRYKFDFGGNLLEEYKVEPQKTNYLDKKTKKWWER